jgi:AraC family transcriptional regulator
MSLMQAQRQRDLKYPTSTELLRSSNELGWSTLIADLRSHSRYEGPGAAAPANAKVGIVVRGSDEGLLTCKVAGSWQSARPTTGSIWLRPIGLTCDEARICSATVEILHLYVPSLAFARLMDDYNLPAVPGHCIRQSCGVRDEVINQIGLSVLSEMMSPTAAGRMLVETSSLLLAARLAHSHSETELIRSPIGMAAGCGVFSHISKSILLKTSLSPTLPMSRVSACFISPAHLPPLWACLRIAT